MRKIILFSLFFIAGIACRHDDPSAILIYKDDGSVQCEVFDKKASLDAMYRELVNNGIDVLESLCGNTGMPLPAVCGGSTGNINIFKIHEQNLNDAGKLEYRELSELEQHIFLECPQE